jgi:hypothetical protein
LAELADAGLIEIEGHRGGRSLSNKVRPLKLDEAIAFAKDGAKPGQGGPRIERQKGGQVGPCFIGKTRTKESTFPSEKVDIPVPKGGLPCPKTWTTESYERNKERDREKEEGRVQFAGIDYSGVIDDPAWPSGPVKLQGNGRTQSAVVNECARLLGCDPIAVPKIYGRYADELIRSKIPSAALNQMTEAAAAGTLDRRDLARAMAALGLPRVDDKRSAAVAVS